MTSSSWKVDALHPTVLGTTISDHFDGLVDQDMMDEVIECEQEDIIRLREAVKSV